MDLKPVKLELAGTGRLRIAWNDGQSREYTFRELRDRCPCATCRERRQQGPTPLDVLPVLSPAEMQPLSILKMDPVGHYAYSIEFSDGHNTGIFQFELLRALGTEVEG